MSMPALDIAQNPLSGRVGTGRRVKDRSFTIFMWTCGLLALLPLAFIAYHVIRLGISAINVDLFTKEPAAPGQPGGGIVQSFIGTAIILGIAIVISVPLGIMSAVYLSEYGRGRFAGTIRFVANILLATPSIVAGAFIWEVVVVPMGGFSGFAGAVALSVLMWPVITLAAEAVLRLVPQDIREGSLALGIPRWKTTLRLVVPTAGAGIFTAIMLAVARGLGETAPILLTALGNDFINTNPFQPTDAVPLRIYEYARTPVQAQHDIAWGAAICLLVTVLILSITARVLANRQQKRLR